MEIMQEIRNNYQEEELLAMAEKKVQKLKRFYIHLVVYIIVVGIYVLNNVFNVPIHFMPVGILNWFVITIWSIIIAIDTVQLLATTIIVGKKWEERQVKKMMERSKNE
jgi:hypothetical protein